MKSRTHISKIPLTQGKKVLIKAAVQTVRAQSSVVFLILRDITGTCQAVSFKGLETFEQAKALSHETHIELTGTVKLTKQTQEGFEVEIETLKVLSIADPELPIPVVEKGQTVSTEKSQDFKFLTLRRAKEATIMKVSSALDAGYREFLLKQGFLEIHTPKLMPTPSESKAELFKLEYFGQTAYLAQSPQLYKQMAISAGLERVFEVAPAFRAEKSYTTRHATEFISYDGEMAYIESFDEVLETIEQMLAYILTSIRKLCAKDVEKHFGVKDFQLKQPIPRLTMAEAKAILKQIGKLETSFGDLTTAEEKAIGDYAKSEFGSDFIFITQFPTEARPFYHKLTAEKQTASADLIYKGVEIITTAQREEHYETLLEQLKEKGLEQEALQWYLDFFKYGCPAHGGWGFGGSRFIMKLLGLASVREATFLYRGPSRITP